MECWDEEMRGPEKREQVRLGHAELTQDIGNETTEKMRRGGRGYRKKKVAGHCMARSAVAENVGQL